MKKQQILAKFQKQIKIENYSKQTIRNYMSVLKLFLEYIENLNLNHVTDKEIQNYLSYFYRISLKISVNSLITLSTLGKSSLGI